MDLGEWLRAPAARAAYRERLEARRAAAEVDETRPYPVPEPEADWGWNTRMGVDVLQAQAARWYGEGTVLSRGDPRPVVLCVGKSPAAREVKSGRPFAGPSGRELDRWLGAAGWALRPGGGGLATNAALWECAAGEEPSAAALAAARPWLRALIQSARPRIVMALGTVAAQVLLEGSGRRTVNALRGRPGRMASDLVALLAEGAKPAVWTTWHPAYVAREPERRAGAVQDLRRMAASIGAAEEGRAAQGSP